MKFKCRSLLGHVLFMTAFQAAVSQAAEISKAATGTVLGDAASWTGGVAPGAGDVAVWNSTSLRSGLSFGADLSWSGMKVSGSTSGITLPSGNILSLGSGGLDINIGNGNSLSIGHPVNIASSQPWKIGNSTGLNLNGSLTGSGVITLTGGGYMNSKTTATGFNGTINYGLGTRLKIDGGHGTWGNVALNVTSSTSIQASSLVGKMKFGDLATSAAGATLGGTDQNGAVTYETGGLDKDSIWAGKIRNGAADQTRATSIVKTGNGTWILTGDNSYTGTTIVNSGRLMINNSAGSGTGSGAVIVGVGGSLGGTGTIGGELTTYFTSSLIPGPGSNQIGTLSVFGKVSLEGDARFLIDRGNALNASLLDCASEVHFGGNLIVENIGPVPQAGDVFTLFTASAFTGSFEGMTLPPLPADLAWNTQNFASTGALSVGQVPVISDAPLAQTTGPGGNVPFTIVATGSSPLTYQWSVDGIPVEGETGATFVWENVPASPNHYLVSASVTNPFGKEIATALLTLEDTSDPVIVSEPSGLSSVAGSAATFEVAVDSFGPVIYQWFRGNSPIDGQTGSTLFLPNVQDEDAGEYHVRITNSFGQARSSSVQLVVTPYIQQANTLTLENNRLRLVFDQTSGISGVLDKHTGKHWSQIQWTIPEGKQQVEDQRFEKPQGQYWNAGHSGVSVKHAGASALRFDATAVYDSTQTGTPQLARLELENSLEIPRTSYHFRFRTKAAHLRNLVLSPKFLMFDPDGESLGSVPGTDVTFGALETHDTDWVERDFWITPQRIPGPFSQAKLRFDLTAGNAAAGSLYLTDVRLIAGNLISDPGFIKPWGWSGWTGSSFVEDPAVTPHKILKVEPALIISSESGYKRQETSFTDSAARTYRVSFRYKAVGLKNLNVLARHNSLIPNQSLNFGNTETTTGWTEFSYLGTTTKGGKFSYYFDFFPQSGAAGELYITDAEVVAIEPGIVHRPLVASSQQVSASKIQYSFNTVERSSSALPALHCTLELGATDGAANELVWKLLGDPNDTLGTSYFAPAFYPAGETALQWLIPSGEGLLLPGSDIFDPINEMVNPSDGNKLRPWTHMMPMALHGGITPQGDGYYVVNDTPVNTHVIYKASQVSPQKYAYMPFISHWGSKGKLHHQRAASIRFVGAGHGYVGIAKDYQTRYAIPKGWHVTYDQKAAYNPRITQYVGTPRLEGLSNGVQADMIADLSAAGINRATLSTTSPANAQAAQAAGWMTTRYDNYWDSIHSTFKTNDWLRRDSNGNVTDTGWGTPENPLYICSPAFIEQVARQDVPIWNQNLNHQTWFIDVFGTVAPYTDYKVGYEYSEIDTLNARIAISKYLTEELGMIFWTEGAAEYLVPYSCYGEGTLTSYGIPGAAHKYRIPLWSLVYHDCWENSWHTYGGNINTAYGWKINDLYNMLYGSKQLLGFTDFTSSSSYYYIPGLKEKAVQSIKKVTAVTRQVGTQVMEEHQFLSEDGNVQMTSYADGTKVYANFGDTPFKSGEIQIAALGHVMVPGSYNSSYAAWRDDNFTPAEVAAGAGDPDAAGTADGMSNFTKYAYGIPNPKLPSTPNWTTNASSTNGLEFSFLRARPELNYRVQTSTDLIIWNDFVVNPGNSGNQVSVTVPVAAGERKKFGRLIVGD